MSIEAAVERIESAKVLDPVAKKLHAFWAKLLPSGPLRDALSGTELAHPVHPALVALPIGMLTGVTGLDLLGGRSARGAARRLTGLGVLAALPAFWTGWSDWLDTSGPERRVGLVHATSNGTGIGLFVFSWLARRRGRHLRGVALAAAGNAALVAGGYLGGHLAYAYGVGVDTTAFQSGPSEWTDVAAADDLAEGTPVGAEAAGVPVLLVRRGGRVLALANRCTHRGAPLSDGSLVDGCIQCPWHGSRFDLADGSVARGPATRPQPVYEVRETGGRIEVRRTERRSLRKNPVGV